MKTFINCIACAHKVDHFLFRTNKILEELPTCSLKYWKMIVYDYLIFLWFSLIHITQELLSTYGTIHVHVVAVCFSV